MRPARARPRPSTRWTKFILRMFWLSLGVAGTRGLAEIRTMTKQALLAEILRLPPSERIELLGDAWDAVAASPQDVPVPEWHVRELERRLAEPDPKYVSWEEVRQRLRRVP